MADRTGINDYDLQASRENKWNISGKKAAENSNKSRKSVKINDNAELDGVNWKDISQSTSLELGEMWRSVCSFLMNLPEHISSLWLRAQQLCYGWIYVLYGKWFEHMMADLYIARKYNLDVIWLRLVKFNPDVRKYCLSESQLLPHSKNSKDTTTSPTALLDLIEIVRQQKNPDITSLTRLLDNIETARTGELWGAVCLVHGSNIEVEGKLGTFISSIRPWSFEIMLSVADNQVINIPNMLRRIEQTGVHIHS